MKNRIRPGLILNSSAPLSTLERLRRPPVWIFLAFSIAALALLTLSPEGQSAAAPGGTLGAALLFGGLFRLRRKSPASPPAEDDALTLRDAWMAIPDSAVLIDEHGRVLAANQACADLLRCPPDALIGRSIEALFEAGPGARLEAAWLLEALQTHGATGSFETTLQLPEGGSLTLEGRGVRLDGRGGTRYALIWRDVSLRSRREQALMQRLEEAQRRLTLQTEDLAQKVDALARANRDLQELDQLRADLISLVSHQIRAPLTNMLGAVERMQGSCASPTGVCQRMFQVLQDQTQRLNRLVGDVLSVAGLESGAVSFQIEPISLMPIFKQAVEEFAARGRRRFHLPFAPVLPTVMADRDRVMEVIVNLLDNADKYAPDGTEVQVQIRPTETEIIVTVLDAGPGLPEQDLERIFDKFYRAEVGDAQRAYGYGLGLYICRRLIEAQGGRIWAENRPQGGAAFSFSLPVTSS